MLGNAFRPTSEYSFPVPKLCFQYVNDMNLLNIYCLVNSISFPHLKEINKISNKLAW